VIAWVGIGLDAIHVETPEGVPQYCGQCFSHESLAPGEPAEDEADFGSLVRVVYVVQGACAQETIEVSSFKSEADVPPRLSPRDALSDRLYAWSMLFQGSELE
jgi:hypothetical protein